MVDLPRLRQVVVVVADLGGTVTTLRQRLGLPEPYADPGVGTFGLRNAVLPVGNDFFEVLTPVTDDASAARYRQRRGGDAGYMAMLQVADIAATRQRLAELGVRIVWQVSLADIDDVHLHPKDVPAAILAVDQPRPPESWRWAGPAWQPRVSRVGIRGMTVAANDPVAVARRWAAVLGLPADEAALSLAGGTQAIRFVPADTRGEGIVGVQLAVAPAAAAAGSFDVAGVRIDLVAAEAAPGEEGRQP